MSLSQDFPNLETALAAGGELTSLYDANNLRSYGPLNSPVQGTPLLDSSHCSLFVKSSGQLWAWYYPTSTLQRIQTSDFYETIRRGISEQEIIDALTELEAENPF